MIRLTVSSTESFETVIHSHLYSDLFFAARMKPLVSPGKISLPLPAAEEFFTEEPLVSHFDDALYFFHDRHGLFVRQWYGLWAPVDHPFDFPGPHAGGCARGQGGILHIECRCLFSSLNEVLP